MNEQRFSGKVALVTGAGSGIGAACAHELAEGGAKVVIADITHAAADKTAVDLRAQGFDATACDVDVANSESVRAMVAFCETTYGGLDIAVNNAGIGGEQAKVGDYPIPSWEKVIATNLTSVFYCMRYEIPVMEKRGKGAIVNMSSILGSVGFAAASGYVAAKHGLVGLTQTAALEYGTAGIRINAVGPGFIETPMVMNGLDDTARAYVASLHAMHRMGQPAEVSALVCFLLSDAASFITGSYHLVDGGYTAQ